MDKWLQDGFCYPPYSKYTKLTNIKELQNMENQGREWKPPLSFVPLLFLTLPFQPIPESYFHHLLSFGALKSVKILGLVFCTVIYYGSSGIVLDHMYEKSSGLEEVALSYISVCVYVFVWK